MRKKLLALWLAVAMVVSNMSFAMAAEQPDDLYAAGDVVVSEVFDDLDIIDDNAADAEEGVYTVLSEEDEGEPEGEPVEALEEAPEETLEEAPVEALEEAPVEALEEAPEETLEGAPEDDDDPVVDTSGYETVIFDMQTDPDFPGIGRAAAAGAPLTTPGTRDYHPYLWFNVAGDEPEGGTMQGSQPNLVFAIDNMTGTSQNLMINISAIPVKPDHHVRLMVEGTHTGEGTAQFRTENGIDPRRLFGGVEIEDGAFAVNHVVPAAEFEADKEQAPEGRYGINTPVGDIRMSGFRIAAICPDGGNCCAPPQKQITLFDMQTDPNFPGIGRAAAAGAPLTTPGTRDYHPYLWFNVAGDEPEGGTMQGTQPNLVFAIDNMTGTSQNLMINISALPVKPAHDVRLVVGGTHTGEGTAQFRTENGIDPRRLFGGVEIEDGAFLVDHIVPASEFEADKEQAPEGRYGINTPVGDIRMSVFQIIALCPAGADCCDDPDVDPPAFTWGQPGGPTLHDSDSTATYRGGDVSYVVGSSSSGNAEPAVLRFNNIGADGVLSDIEKTMLREAASVTFVMNPGMTGNRAIHVWTDLSDTVSGSVGNVNDETFINETNRTAGAIITLSQGTSLSAEPAEIELPIELLYQNEPGGTEVFANAVYVLVTRGDRLDLTVNMTEPDDCFRAANLNAQVYAFLRANERPPFATNISLNWGVDETEMRVTWWTPKGEAVVSVVQLAPASELTDDGQMPAGARTVIGAHPEPIPSDMPMYAFDVNRAILQNLVPGTEYAYRVGDGNADNWSRVYKFRTYDVVTGHKAVLFGDPQISSSSITRMRNTWEHTLNAAITRADGAALAISAGDNITNDNAVDQLEAYLYPAALRSLPMFTTVGNHDTNDPRNEPGYDTSLSLLSFAYYWPNHDWLGGSPTATDLNRRGGGNHYFVLGNTLYITLNGNIGWENGLTEFRKTIEEAIAAHPNTDWRIVTFHQDIFGPGTGHAAAMAASGRQVWGELFTEFGIDIVFNGHDHTYGRSLFLDGTTPVMQQRPAELGRNDQELLVYEANPGTFIAPDGILYITLPAAADFPKYTAAEPPFPWIAYADGYDADAQYGVMVIDGDSLSFTNYVIPYNHTTRVPSGAPEFVQDSFTIRKTARYEDLVKLRTDANAIEATDITVASFNAFRTAITNANAITESSPAANIHSAYMAIYEAYYALESTANKTALNALVQEVAATLETAVEGRWEGQFPKGSLAPFRVIFEEASLVNDVRLSTQAQIDAAYNKLKSAYDILMDSRGTIPVPWINVHDIPASGEYVLGLLHWMDDSVGLNLPYEEETTVSPKFFAHNTKVNFAGGYLAGGSYSILNEHPFTAIRSENPWGPANREGGGRAYPEGYITKTHAGEWIRYELNVAEAGEYKVQLGAINAQTQNMEVRLRDLDRNTLANFTIPAGHGSGGWDSAALIEADSNIYLPAGNFVLEMVFMNHPTASTATHINSGIVATYPDGPDVDILVLERVGDAEPPVYTRPALQYQLPLPPTMSAGTARRQRGWGTLGTSYEYDLAGEDTRNNTPIEVFNTATHLVFEAAARPTGNIDLVLMGFGNGASGGWIQDSIQMNDIWDPETRLVTIDLSTHRGYNDLRIAGGSGTRIILTHNSDTWEELNLIDVYLILDTPYDPDDPPIPGEGEWKQDEEGYWYLYYTDEPVTSSWEKWRGRWYYLGEDGKMKTGWFYDPEYSAWFYLSRPNGDMLRNTWLRWQDDWYYFKNDGEMASGEWITWRNNEYYLTAEDPEGHMVTGWYETHDRGLCFFDEDGAYIPGDGDEDPDIKPAEGMVLRHTHGENWGNLVLNYAFGDEDYTITFVVNHSSTQYGIQPKQNPLGGYSFLDENGEEDENAYFPTSSGEWHNISYTFPGSQTGGGLHLAMEYPRTPGSSALIDNIVIRDASGTIVFSQDFEVNTSGFGTQEWTNDTITRIPLP